MKITAAGSTDMEDGDTISPEALANAMIRPVPLNWFHDAKPESLGKVKSVKMVNGILTYDLDLNEAGQKFMADLGKAERPNIIEQEEEEAKRMDALENVAKALTGEDREMLRDGIGRWLSGASPGIKRLLKSLEDLDTLNS